MELTGIFCFITADVHIEKVKNNAKELDTKDNNQKGKWINFISITNFLNIEY